MCYRNREGGAQAERGVCFFLGFGAFLHWCSATKAGRQRERNVKWRWVRQITILFPLSFVFQKETHRRLNFHVKQSGRRKRTSKLGIVQFRPSQPSSHPSSSTVGGGCQWLKFAIVYKGPGHSRLQGLKTTEERATRTPWTHTKIELQKGMYVRQT